jgi:hypothetical protein
VVRLYRQQLCTNFILEVRIVSLLLQLLVRTEIFSAAFRVPLLSAFGRSFASGPDIDRRAAKHDTQDAFIAEAAYMWLTPMSLFFLGVVDTPNGAYDAQICCAQRTVCPRSRNGSTMNVGFFQCLQQVARLPST